MCVSVCHGIHCQVSDRFLFVHKLHPVISSIFKTIKQRRENGWLGNPWILICQQNENESGRWWKCAEWEVAADVREEQTFFFFILGCSHLLPSHVDLMRTTYCQRFGIAANLDATAREMPVVQAVFLATREKSTGFRQTLLWSHLQTWAASNQQVWGRCLKPRTYGFYLEKQAREKTSMLGAEMTRLWII